MTLSKTQMFGISSRPDNATVNNRGTILHSDKFGTDLAMRAKVTPPVAAYDEYVKAAQKKRYRNCHRNQRFQGCFLRRAVIMRRQGETWADIGRAIGISSGTIKDWVEFLPLDLQP